jgi:cytochrome c oxidase subunit 4
MAEPHAAYAHDTEAHHGPPVQTYVVIFGALVIFTTVSFIANGLARAEVIGHGTSFTIILAVAVCKAVLVAMYFMHLKFEWGKLYFLVIPVLILTVMMMIVLLPDIVLAWHQHPPLGHQERPSPAHHVVD